MNKRFAYDLRIRYVLAIFSFFVPIVVMVFVLVLQKSVPFGNASFLYCDAHDQYYSMFREFIQWLRTKDSGFCIWNRGLGVDIYREFLYYGISPFNFIAVFFGIDQLELAMTLIILLKMGSISSATYYYFCKTRVTEFTLTNTSIRYYVAFTMGLAFSLGNYVLSYNSNLMWLDSLILMPFMLLGIEKIRDNGNKSLYILTLALCIISNFYFSFFVCIFSIIYFFFLDYRDRKSLLNSLAVFCGSSLLAGIIAGVILVPAYFAIVNRGSYDYSSFIDAITKHGNFFDFLSALNPITTLDGKGGYFYTANIYCGSFAILAFVLLGINSGVTLLHRIKAMVVVVILAIAMNIKEINYVFHGFSYPHGLSNRFAFIFSFMLIIIMYEVIVHIDTVSRMCILGCSIGLVACAILEMLFMPKASCLFLLISAVIFSILAFFLFRKIINVKTYIYCIITYLCIELVCNCIVEAPQKVTEENILVETGYSNYQYVYDNLPLDLGQRKTSLSKRRFVCASDTNWYSSLINGSMVDSFQSLGLSNYEAAEAIYRGTTPFTALLYNVRYIMTDEIGLCGGYTKIRGDYPIEGIDLYENDYIAGFGFMTSDKVLEWKGEADFAENQSTLFEKMVGYENYNLFDDNGIKFLGVKSQFASINDYSENFCDYDSLVAYYPYIILQYEIEDDCDLYFWADDANGFVVQAWIDGIRTVGTKSLETSTTVHIGEVSSGQKVKIQVQVCTNKKGIHGKLKYKISSFNTEVFEKGLIDLNDEVFEVEKMSSIMIEGQVEAKSDGILYMALPYSKGYRVWVDDNEGDAIKIGTGLMGIPVTAGKHEIRLCYSTPGISIGIFISILGILLLGVYNFSCISVTHKGKK